LLRSSVPGDGDHREERKAGSFEETEEESEGEERVVVGRESKPDHREPEGEKESQRPCR